jgi:hypothetical protein
MNKSILDQIMDICKLVAGKAELMLQMENLKPFDQQYYIGRKHAAKDIFKRVEELFNESK